MLPPLRMRREDIPPLIERFWREATRGDRAARRCWRRCRPPALTALTNAHWPGNLDHLANVVANLALRARRDHRRAREARCSAKSARPSRRSRRRSPRASSSFRCARRARRSSASTSSSCSGREQSNMSKVAEKAGLERTHLYRKLKQLNIRFSRRTDDSARCRPRSACDVTTAHRIRKRRCCRWSSARSASCSATSARSPLYTLRKAFTRRARPAAHAGERLRPAVAHVLGARRHRHAEVRRADHARRQPRRRRHPRADRAGVARARAPRRAGAGGSSASASSARRCSTATA